MTGLASSELYTHVFILCDTFRMLNWYAPKEKVMELNKTVFAERKLAQRYFTAEDQRCELFTEVDQQWNN